MRYLFLFMFLGGMVFNANAQKRNAVYVEALGNGLIYSVNYDYQLLQSTNLGVRLGVNFFNRSENVLMFPAHIRYVIGNKHGLEIGAGLTYQFRFANDQSSNSEDVHLVVPSGALMYRFQADNGLLLRAGLAPTFVKYDKKAKISPAFLYFWPGASIGYAF